MEIERKIQSSLAFPDLTGAHYLLQRPSLIREVKKQLLEELKVQEMQNQISKLTELTETLKQKIFMLETEVNQLKLTDWHKVEVIEEEQTN